MLILDFSLVRCAWRALRRSRERADFWWWLLLWRQRSRPAVLAAVESCAPTADVHLLRTPGELARFVEMHRIAADESNGDSQRSE